MKALGWEPERTLGLQRVTCLRQCGRTWLSKPVLNPRVPLAYGDSPRPCPFFPNTVSTKACVHTVTPYRKGCPHHFDTTIETGLLGGLSSGLLLKQYKSMCIVTPPSSPEDEAPGLNVCAHRTHPVNKTRSKEDGAL